MAMFRWVIDGEFRVGHRWRYSGGSLTKMLRLVTDGGF